MMSIAMLGVGIGRGTGIRRGTVVRTVRSSGSAGGRVLVPRCGSLKFQIVLGRPPDSFALVLAEGADEFVVRWVFGHLVVVAFRFTVAT